MKFYIHFITHIQKTYTGFIFAAIFFSLLAGRVYAETFNPELTDFTGRMIGAATLEGYDITKRVSAFYTTGAILLGGFFFFSWITWRISWVSKYLKTTEFRIINYTALSGLILLFFTLWTDTVTASLQLIYCIQTAAFLGFGLKKAILNNDLLKLLDSGFYAFAFIIGFSMFFILNELSVLFELDYAFHLTGTVLFSVVLTIFFACFLIRKKVYAAAKESLRNGLIIFIPLAFIPLLSFFKDEIYLVLNRQKIDFFTPRDLYITGLFLVVTSIFFRYKKAQKKTISGWSKSIQQLIATQYFPALVIGITTFTFYNPFIEASTEMFEAGNRFLPIMEFKEFGVVPIFEKFNSHMLSEIFFAGIYTFFNGLNARELVIYDFFSQVLGAILVYFFMYKLSRNAYAAIFLVLLFPLTDYLFDNYIIIALVGIFVLNKVIAAPGSLSNYLLLMAVMVFLIVWRIDIGYPAAIGIMITLFIYRINGKRFILNSKILLQATGIVIVVTLFLLLLLSWWRNINVFEKMWLALNYLSSAQTYGLVNYGELTLSAHKMQYFIFPIIIITGIFTALVLFKYLNVSKGQRFVYISFIYLTFYYLINFQRGLVRHSFAEGHDSMLSAFVFFILSGSIYLFGYKKTQVCKFVVFVAMAIFLLMNYKFPGIAAIENMYAKTVRKTETFSALVSGPPVTRVAETNTSEDKRFGNFKQFITEHLTAKQTFIDFSNIPMLYYITKKITPSYFYQNPLTIHNDYLQHQFIIDLQNYNAPFIVFSYYPENFWNVIDGVPNGIRHYKMAEYFYRNYQPFVIIDSLCIWKRNDCKINNHEKNVYGYYANNKLHSLKKEGQSISGEIKNTGRKNYLFKVTQNDLKAEKPSVVFKNEQGVAAKILHSFDEAVSDSASYYFFISHEKDFTFTIDDFNKNITSVIVTECDYIPDFYSTLRKNYTLNQLPYIWATYDKTVHQEEVLIDFSSKSNTLIKDSTLVFNFPPLIDKSSGNTVLISLQCENEHPVTLQLTYGVANEGFKGVFTFAIPQGSGERELAVRISSQYNWYMSTINQISLSNENTTEVTIKKMQLLKGS